MSKPKPIEDIFNRHFKNETFKCRWFEDKNRVPSVWFAYLTWTSRSGNNMFFGVEFGNVHLTGLSDEFIDRMVRFRFIDYYNHALTPDRKMVGIDKIE
jgi:hypothetical protein